METSGQHTNTICHKKGSFELGVFLIFFSGKTVLMILSYIHGSDNHHQTMMIVERWKPVSSALTPYVTRKDLFSFSDDVFSHLLLENIVDDSFLHSRG